MNDQQEEGVGRDDVCVYLRERDWCGCSLSEAVQLATDRQKWEESLASMVHLGHEFGIIIIYSSLFTENGRNLRIVQLYIYIYIQLYSPSYDYGSKENIVN